MEKYRPTLENEAVRIYTKGSNKGIIVGKKEITFQNFKKGTIRKRKRMIENENAENLVFQIQELEKQHLKCGALKKKMFDTETEAFNQADERAEEHIIFERYERDLKSE